jgi:NADH-ubiquinone oxidoreductase chain 5
VLTFVSALVHPSTVVTAGVYLLIHFRPAFSDWLFVFLLLFSDLRIFLGDLGGNFEYVLWKIVFSTLIQRGLINNWCHVDWLCWTGVFPIVDSCFV